MLLLFPFFFFSKFKYSISFLFSKRLRFYYFILLQVRRNVIANRVVPVLSRGGRDARRAAKGARALVCNIYGSIWRRWKKKKGKHDICRNVGLPESLRARHTAYGDAPNNVQQISKYKIMVRNHGHGHINHLIIISYHIVSCHHGHRHIIKDSCFVPRGACTRKRKLKIWRKGG